MAIGGGTQQSIRKALGALKDSTTVGLAKVNSDYKELDVAIVKATNHVEHLAKEKHMFTIFDAVSASRPRADVVYCINALARRLAKTHNWAVALKTLIIIHRALREVDPTFREALINYMKTRGHMLNLSHFKDDSSPNAWDYSAWVRAYALYLEERLECFRVLKYDVDTAVSRTSELDTIDLLEHLSALQQLLYRLVTCQPEGTAVYNSVIRYALSIVAGESVKIYSAINGGTLNLVDKRHDAVRALEIYRKAGSQAERLSEFYEICKGLDSAVGQKLPKIEQPPVSFIAAMEEYVKDAPRVLLLNQNVVNNDRSIAAKPVLAIEQKNMADGQEKPESAPMQTPTTSEGAKPPAAETAQTPVQVQTQVADLLSLDNFNPSATELEDKNSFALAIVANDNPSNNTSTPDLSSASTAWELALISAPSSNESAVAGSKLAGGLDKLTLDSLYDDAIARRTNQNGSYHMGQVAPNPFEVIPSSQDPFCASNSIAAPASVQMATMAQQQALMMQGQQQAMGLDASNPFGNPFGTTGGQSYPTHNPYAGYM